MEFIKLTNEQLALIIAEKTTGAYTDGGAKLTSDIISKADAYLRWLKENKTISQ